MFSLRIRRLPGDIEGRLKVPLYLLLLTLQPPYTPPYIQDVRHLDGLAGPWQLVVKFRYLSTYTARG